jgi:hypothetical protein
MSKNILFIGDRRRTNCVQASTHLYHKQGDTDQALTFSRNQLSLLEKHLPKKHQSLAYLLMKIGELS